jgi:hypothetical protein
MGIMTSEHGRRGGQKVLLGTFCPPRPHLSLETPRAPPHSSGIPTVMTMMAIAAPTLSRWSARDRLHLGIRGERVRQRDAGFGRQSPHEDERRPAAMRTGQSRSRRLRSRGGLRRSRRERELEPTQRGAVSRVEQAKRTHAMKATGQDVLQEATQEFVSGEAHGLALVIAAVLVAEGHRTIVEVVDRTVGDRGLMDVATEVVEDLLRALHRGFGVSCYVSGSRRRCAGDEAGATAQSAVSFNSALDPTWWAGSLCSPTHHAAQRQIVRRADWNGPCRRRNIQ